MNSGKGNMILLTVIAVATLLVAVVGATSLTLAQLWEVFHPRQLK